MAEQKPASQESLPPKVRVAAIATHSRHESVSELFLSVRHRVCDVLYVAIDDADDDDDDDVGDERESGSSIGDRIAVNENQLLVKRLRIVNEIYRLSVSACPTLSVRILFRHSVALRDSSNAENGRATGDGALSCCPEVIFVSERTLTRSSSHAPPLLNWLESRCVSVYGRPVVERTPTFDPADSALISHEVPSERSIFTTSAPSLCAYENVVMGGTFDRLHCGHCLLLTSAALLTRRKLVIGVCDGNLLQSKTVRELVEPIGYRIQQINAFLADVAPNVLVRPQAIHEPSGPAVDDADLNCIVASQETLQGTVPINQQRKAAGLSQLSVVSVSLLSANCGADKVSSTHGRRAGLGKLLPAYVPGRTNSPWMTRLQKSIQQNEHNAPVEEIAGFMGDKSINIKLPPPEQLQKTPYVIGLTGGIASGKSTLSAKMKDMGAAIVSCDLLAHQAYMPGTVCYDQLLSTFGEHVVNDDGTVNRQRLAEIVFKSPEQLAALNRVVWPVVARMINDTMVHHTTEGTHLVVVESALLKEAGMDRLVDEVWTMMVPQDEALKRLQSSGYSAAQAKERVSAQATSQQRMDYSSLVLSSRWSKDDTVRNQLIPAWEGLMTRMKCFKMATIGRTFEERFVKVCRACGVQAAVAKEFFSAHLRAYHAAVDEQWSGEDSAIRKLNQCDYLLPALGNPSLLQLALFFSRGGLVPPLLDADKVRKTTEFFQLFVTAASLSERKQRIVNGYLSSPSVGALVPAGCDYEYFCDLEVTEDCRMLVVESELGVQRLPEPRRKVYHLLELSPRVLRTPEMDRLLGLRIKAKLRRKRA